MAAITVEHLTFSYPASDAPVFDDVSFSIDTDWKCGFVGRNGRGKTTFLRLLQGKYAYDGKIVSPVAFDYFPFAVTDKHAYTEELLREVCPTAEEWEFLRELSYLDVDADVLYKRFDTLSEGERTKALLAALFIKEGNFLLIDEPTNHLDANARQSVSAYLRRKKGFLLVSHDRSFLDGCVDHILSINRANIEVQAGNFSSFMQNFERQQAYETAQNDKLQGEIKRLQQSARQSAAWSDKTEASKRGADVLDRGYVGHKAAKMMQSAKNLAHRQQRAVEQKSALLKNVEIADTLKISPLTYRSERLATFADVSPRYDGKAVCAPVSFAIERGERIALQGANGSGKSSLLKLLCGQPIDYDGKLTIGSQLKISYLPQDTSRLYGTLAELAKECGVEQALYLAVLHKMGVEKSQFFKDVSAFSDGQKKKALLAKSLCESAHLYVWDEPLNFIDVYSRMQIEDLLQAFRPTMIFVEHDAAFVQKIATSAVHVSK